MRDLAPYVASAATELDGFVEDNVPLLDLLRKVSATRVLPDYQKVVLAQCEIAVENYAAILTLVADRFGVPAFGLCRNLFELAVVTVHLTRNPDSLKDFTQYAIKHHYELIRDTLPQFRKTNPWMEQDLDLRQLEYEALDKYFGPRNWHGKQVRQLAEDADFGQLYLTFYKTASSFAHGDGFLLLRRRHFKAWDLAINKSMCDSYISLSGRFAYLMMASLFDEVNHSLNLGHDVEVKTLRDYVHAHPEYEVPPEFK